MRRLIIEEPVSRAAALAPRVASFALAVTLIAVVLLRYQVVELLPGFVSLGAGLALALAAALLSFVAFVRIWMEGRRGLGRAIKGLLLALMILGYPGYLGARSFVQPALSDVSTDVESPPSFSRSRAVLQARRGRVPPDPPLSDRLAQRAAYPQIAPLTLDIGGDEAFELVRKAATNRGWQVLEAIKPGGRSGLGRLEAVDRTLLLRLPGDVTVRLRPRAEGTRIDVRSASRLDFHDFGQNAQTIRRFLDEVSNLAVATK